MTGFKNIIFTLVLGVGLFVVAFPAGATLTLTIDNWAGGFAPVTLSDGSGVSIGLVGDSHSQWVQIPTGAYTPSLQPVISATGAPSTGYNLMLKVPEPPTLLLLGAGLVGLAAWGRWRMRRIDARSKRSSTVGLAAWGRRRSNATILVD